MKRTNLIVIQIGRNEALRGQRTRQTLQQADINAQLLKPLQVVARIFTYRCNGDRLAPQELQVIGNIASTPTEFAAHAGHQE